MWSNFDKVEMKNLYFPTKVKSLRKLRKNEAIGPSLKITFIVITILVLSIVVFIWINDVTKIISRYFERIEIVNAYATVTDSGWNILITIKNNGSIDARVESISINEVQVKNLNKSIIVNPSLPLDLPSKETKIIQIVIKRGAKIDSYAIVSGMTITITIHTSAGKSYSTSIFLQ